VPVEVVDGFRFGLFQNPIKKETDFIKALSWLGQNT